MSALTAERNTPSRDGDLISLPVAAAKTLYAGGFGAVDANGRLTPGATATTLKGLGRVEATADNSTGADGAIYGTVRLGVFRWANSASADLIAAADVGKVCYLVDDQTVAKTTGGGTRSPAGIIVDVDSLGVWVDSRPFHTVSTSGAVLTANNLSDVTAATARGNLGVYLDHMGDPGIAEPGAEAGDVITVGVQLKTIGGADLAAVGAIHGFLAADAAGAAVTGLTIASLANGTDGEVIPTNATNTTFIATSESDGDIDIAVGCAGTGTCYLILITPRGKLVASSAITFT